MKQHKGATRVVQTEVEDILSFNQLIGEDGDQCFKFKKGSCY